MPKSSALTFAHVHTTARHLTFEALGAEGDIEGLVGFTAQLFDDLPEERQAECWDAIGRECDRLNTGLNEGLPERRRSAATPANVRPLRSHVDDPLRAIPLAVAVEILTGTEVPASRMIRCPLPGHEDRTPSCHVNDELWFCHGCGAGGDLLELGAQLFGIEARGSGYFDLRQRLALELLGREVA